MNKTSKEFVVQSKAYVTEPFSIPLGENSISAVLGFDESGKCWDVTVVIQRASGQPQIRGDEVKAQLSDERGAELQTLTQASGLLVEAGGSLGTSANAQFQFESSDAAPSCLLVTYQGQTVSFRIVPLDSKG
jgi:hypothetical protein